jgi:hypothetical protein
MIFENLSMRWFVRILYLGSLDAALITLSSSLFASSSDMIFLILIIRNQVRDLARLRDVHSILSMESLLRLSCHDVSRTKG